MQRKPWTSKSATPLLAFITSELQARKGSRGAISCALSGVRKVLPHLEILLFDSVNAWQCCFYERGLGPRPSSSWLSTICTQICEFHCSNSGCQDWFRQSCSRRVSKDFPDTWYSNAKSPNVLITGRPHLDSVTDCFRRQEDPAPQDEEDAEGGLGIHSDLWDHGERGQDDPSWESK